MAALDQLLANRFVLTGMLAAIGLAIALGPELRGLVARVRRDAAKANEPASSVGASMR